MIVCTIVDVRHGHDDAPREGQLGIFEGQLFFERDLVEGFLEDIRRDDRELAANLATRSLPLSRSGSSLM